MPSDEAIPEPNKRFRRVVIKVRLERGGTVEAWTYEAIELPAARRLIESGDFILHLQRRTGPSSPLDCHLWEVLQSLRELNGDGWVKLPE
jgi:hypothetical protein